MSAKYSTVPWANGSGIYEVNIRQYTTEGNFNAFAKHLPRLRDMGVKILWLMPITPISIEKRLGSLGSYYACSSYTKINPEFGTVDDFKSLVNNAHELGFKLMIDWVANHTGWDHEWTKAHPDWYLKNAEGNFTELNGWVDVIDLDYKNKNMRDAMTDAMKFWITECDIDGFRCDMAHLVPLDFWSEARQECDAIKPMLWLAECDVTEYNEIFDITYAWNWMHASENFAKNKAPLQQVKDVLYKYSQLSKDSQKLFFTSNHDENSWNGTEYEKYGDAAKAFAVFTCTWPGIPLIYSGQELPNLKRLKFFDKDLIEWNNAKPLLHDFYKTLFLLRRKNNALHKEAGSILLTTGEDDKILVYLNVNGNNKVLVILNFSGNDKLKFSITYPQLAGKYKNIFSGFEYSFETIMQFELQAWEYFVYETIN